MTALRSVGGSFRDARSRVFDDGTRIVRALSVEGRADLDAARATAFFTRAVADGRLVATTDVEDPAEVPDGWASAVEHPRLDVISYPYEWSFSMLRDAALLQLELLAQGLPEGIGCKDGTPYNIQFAGGRPRFIDVGSFAPVGPDGWPGYRQFCQLQLYPLLIEAHLDVAFGPLLRGSLEGIAPDVADRLLRGRHRLRRGVLTHVSAQAWAARRYATRPDRAAEVVGSTGIGPDVVAGLVDRTAATVAGLRPPDRATAWTDYSDRDHYAAEALRTKDRVVDLALEQGSPETVLDLGCNDGRFALAAARRARTVVAVDADRAVIDDLYRRVRARRTAVLPLVVDLADPSPALGWGLAERPALRDRVRPDLVLALALIHHLVIGRNVPVDAFLAELASWGPEAVLEVPDRHDPMVARLLAAKPDDTHADYRLDHIEDRIERRFTVVERIPLSGGTRVLYRLRRR